MSGTQASLSSKAGGLAIPQPILRIVSGVSQSGAVNTNDLVYVGSMGDAAYAQLKDLSPQVWLFRYKRGPNNDNGRNPHSGYLFDNRRGYVHPSDTLNGSSGRKYSGGSHNTRNGSTAPARQTEWNVTKPHFYDAVFDASRWFLDNSANQLIFPVQPIASATGNEWSTIGNSGQGTNNTGTFPQSDQPGFCGSGQTKGTQKQWFAFAFTVKDPQDERNHIVGPLSEVIRAQIWPHVKVNYGDCLPKYDRGRKIRVTHK